MQGASFVTEHRSPSSTIGPTQQSSFVRPLPRLEQPEPPQVPHPGAQQAVPLWTPGIPFEQVEEMGDIVGEPMLFAEVGAGVGARVVGGASSGNKENEKRTGGSRCPAGVMEGRHVRKKAVSLSFHSPTLPSAQMTEAFL